MLDFGEAIRDVAKTYVHMEEYAGVCEFDMEQAAVTMAGTLAIAYELDEDYAATRLRKWIHVMRATKNEWYPEYCESIGEE